VSEQPLTRPRAGGAPAAVADGAAKPEAARAVQVAADAETPRGALVISLSYCILLGLLWGFMYMQTVRAG